MQNNKKQMNSAELFEFRVANEVESGGDVVKFIEEYIEERTYKTFRTFAKRVSEVNNSLLEYGFIDKAGFKRIEASMKKKRTEQEPKLIFRLDGFLEDYMLLFHSIKHNIKNPLNVLFLAMPFFRDFTYAQIINIEKEDIVVEKSDTLVRVYLKTDEKQVPITIMRYSNEWYELLEVFRKDSDNTKLLKDLGATNSAFSSMYNSYLSSYSTSNSIEFRYFSAIRNSLKYSGVKFVV